MKRAAEFGNGKIHIIVNNAGFTWDGVIHKVRELFSELSSREFLYLSYTKYILLTSASFNVYR